MFKQGKTKKFLALIILDGWGVAKPSDTNLISVAKTPNFTKLIESYSAAVLTNPLDKTIFEANTEDVCRLSHYLIGTGRTENNISTLERLNPLAINSLSRVLSQNNLKQLYLFDNEKFAQSSYFFRGCYSKLLKGEKQVLAKGKVITDYSLNPEGHLKELLKALKTEITSGKFNFVFINLSNIDIVAHTGNREATIQAIESVDKYLGQIVDKILSAGGEILITADHGKAETFVSNDEQSVKAHTTNLVPLLFVSKNLEGRTFPGVNLVGSDLSTLSPIGFLTDIAPTILNLLNIKKPAEMIGKALINL